MSILFLSMLQYLSSLSHGDIIIVLIRNILMKTVNQRTITSP